MNCPENWILIICCSLLSFCLIFIMILMISILRITKKITKIFTNILSFINLENKILTPIFILKKIFFSFFLKRNHSNTKNKKNKFCPEENLSDKEFSQKERIIKILKLTIILVSVLRLLKNKKEGSYE